MYKIRVIKTLLFFRLKNSHIKKLITKQKARHFFFICHIILFVENLGFYKLIK